MTRRPIQVKFIGSGDAFGNGGRFQACILLRAPGHAEVLLDCGASSLVALKQQRHDPAKIGLMLVSHLHGDHFGGVPFLVLDGQFTHRTRPLHVAGPAGVRERVQAAMEVLFPGSTRVQRRFEVQFHELLTGSRSRPSGPRCWSRWPEVPICSSLRDTPISARSGSIWTWRPSAAGWSVGGTPHRPHPHVPDLLSRVGEVGFQTARDGMTVELEG